MFPLIDLTPGSAQLLALQEQARTAGRLCVASAIIVDSHGRAFVQRRAPHRRLFPACWDIVGGHVEDIETLFAALEREVAEETGWCLRRLVHLIDVVDWETEQDRQILARREFCFVVEVEGNLDRPRLELEKVTEFRWVGPDDVGILREHRVEGDTVIYDLIRQGLQHTRD